MKLRPDGISNGWRGVIYDEDDASRSLLWQCLHHPPHPTKAEAKTCARAKIQQLSKRSHQAIKGKES